MNGNFTDMGLALRLYIRQMAKAIPGEWQELGTIIPDTQGELSWQREGIKAHLALTAREDGYDFTLSFQSDAEIQAMLCLDAGGEEAFHLIPCNIYGDNNAARVRTDQYPLLTAAYPEATFAAPAWQFRADRAAMPLSAMAWKKGCAGLFIEPYAAATGVRFAPEGEGFYGPRLHPTKQDNAEFAAAPYAKTEREWIHNGLYAALPARCGVTVGYRNEPVTFADKMHAALPTAEAAKSASVRGCLWLFPGAGKEAIHRMVRSGYVLLHERPVYQRSFTEAAEAMTRSFTGLNYEEDRQAYTDMDCKPPMRQELKGWRGIYEIGWTGLAELAAPLVMADKLLEKDCINRNAPSGYALIDNMLETYNPHSGLFNNLVKPVNDDGSLVNGWWNYLGIAVDAHSAYIVGKAVHQILLAAEFLRGRGEKEPSHWLPGCLRVLDTILRLMREDGSCGYSYSTEEEKMVDHDGFAGCWFVPSFAMAYRLTGEGKYLDAAKRAQAYYRHFVLELNAYATPMDTYRAVDEEGNLAFIKGSRLLHELTGEDVYLADLEAGANYEYLWRFGYRTRPECTPLSAGWNACGGSVTSISNPHIHPMGVIVDDDLRYLAEKTGDPYHADRAEDGDAWMMQCLEWYPERSGYGQYGIISERWCPSDGLVTETTSDGKPYASWLTYNLWAAGNVLEAVLKRVEQDG